MRVPHMLRSWFHMFFFDESYFKNKYFEHSPCVCGFDFDVGFKDPKVIGSSVRFVC